MALSALLLEDDPAFAAVARKTLEGAIGIAPLFHVNSLAAATVFLERGMVDVLLLDLNLPDSKGLDTLGAVRERFADIPVVVITAADDPKYGLEALRLGAQDYFEKDRMDPDRFRLSILYAIERSHAQARLEAARPDLRGLHAPQKFDDLAQVYRELLESAIADRVFKAEPRPIEEIRDLAFDLGALGANPRDVVEVHVEGLKSAIERAPQIRAHVLVEEARFLVLRLMGELAAFYQTCEQTAV